jgi:hypothetical protein
MLYIYFFLFIMKNTQKITALKTFSVRQEVLRKGKPIETCRFEGHNLSAMYHINYYQNNILTGIISIYKNNNSIFASNNQYQIRDMAVLETDQKKDKMKHWFSIVKPISLS